MKVFVVKFAKMEEGQWRETYRRETFSMAEGSWSGAVIRAVDLIRSRERVVSISEGGYQ